VLSVSLGSFVSKLGNTCLVSSTVSVVDDNLLTLEGLDDLLQTGKPFGEFLTLAIKVGIEEILNIVERKIIDIERHIL
jgi:hypothetical protein